MTAHKQIIVLLQGWPGTGRQGRGGEERWVESSALEVRSHGSKLFKYWVFQLAASNHQGRIRIRIRRSPCPCASWHHPQQAAGGRQHVRRVAAAEPGSSAQLWLWLCQVRSLLPKSKFHFISSLLYVSVCRIPLFEFPVRVGTPKYIWFVCPAPKARLKS